MPSNWFSPAILLFIIYTISALMHRARDAEATSCCWNACHFSCFQHAIMIGILYIICFLSGAWGK